PRGANSELLVLVALGPLAQQVQRGLCSLDLRWRARDRCEQIALRQSAACPEILHFCVALELCGTTHDLPVARVLKSRSQRRLQRKHLDPRPVVLDVPTVAHAIAVQGFCQRLAARAEVEIAPITELLSAVEEQFRKTFVRTGKQTLQLVDEMLTRSIEVFAPRNQRRDPLAKLRLNLVELGGFATLQAEVIGTLLLCVEHAELGAQAE